MSSKVFIGIDPGVSGAIAFVFEHGAPVVFDTPTLQIKRGKSIKHTHNERAMAQLLADCSNPKHAVIEDVHAMPGQGSVSMFSFGQGFGTWLGILAALGIPYDRVPPQRWKKDMMAGLQSDKDAARMRAISLFPALQMQLARKKDDGRAEALLLAEWGRRTAGGAA